MTPEVPIDAELADRAHSVAAERGDNVDAVVTRALREYVEDPMPEARQSKRSMIVMGLIAAVVLAGSIIVLGYGLSQGNVSRCEGTISTDAGCFR